MNGGWWAVKIDDFFPVDRNNDLLCSFSKEGKLWTSLLEKAYLKLCNGYNFCGSNTSRDLFIFTGWLPERVKCTKIDDEDKLWGRIWDADLRWDVMISISTDDISEVESKIIGLVSNHAYAVLEL